MVIRHLQDMSRSWQEEGRVLQVDGIESKATTCWREELGGSEGSQDRPSGRNQDKSSCLDLLLGDV